MLIAGMGVVAALAFVLGLGALCLYALKRWGTGALRARNRVPLEVVQRVSLGPKTGLAVVRVGEKVMALSVGEGGIRTLFELDESDRRRIIASSTIPTVQESSAEAVQAFSSVSSISSIAQANATGPFASLMARSLNQSVKVSSAAQRFKGVFAEIPGFLTDAPTTSKGSLNTYSRPKRAGSVPTEKKVLDIGMDRLLAGSLSTATKLMSLLFMTMLVGATSLHAESAGTVMYQQPPAIQPPSVQPPITAVAPNTNSANAVPAPTAPIAADDAIMRLMPQVDMQLGGNGTDGGLRLNGTVGIVVMMGLLTLLPTLLLMMTGFTRILVVLHFLKQAMGTQSAPPGHLLAGMALLLTGFVMGPTLTEVNRTAVTPWLNGEMTQVDMMKTGVQPFREFMLRQTRTSDVETFVRLSRIPQPNTIDDVPLHVLMSAFVASELRTAFQIGFAIYLPFIIIDAVVASVLMSMGMFMLPPAMISLPFKLLLFVLVDGWSLTITSLVQSFR